MEVHNREDYERALRIGENLGYGFWLGGNDKEMEGNWVWNSNAEKVKFNEFWRSSRPKQDRDQNCLVMGNDGMWDASCANTRKTICMFD